MPMRERIIYLHVNTNHFTYLATDMYKKPSSHMGEHSDESELFVFGKDSATALAGCSTCSV